MGPKGKRSFVPAYYLVADDLSHDIEAGRLQPGDSTPSESQLCERYGISRMTVRQGLNLLGDAGYIYSVPGKGSFVTAPRLDRMSIEFREGVLADGRRLQPRLIEIASVQVPADAAQNLGVPPETPVIEFRRLSSLEGTPVAFEQKYVPYDTAPSLTEHESRYAAFPELVARMCQIHLVKVRVALSTGRGSVRAADLLGLSRYGGMALIVEQTVLDREDAVLGWGRTYCLPDHYRLEAESDPFWRGL